MLMITPYLRNINLAWGIVSKAQNSKLSNNHYHSNLNLQELDLEFTADHSPIQLTLTLARGEF